MQHPSTSNHGTTLKPERMKGAAQCTFCFGKSQRQYTTEKADMSCHGAGNSLPCARAKSRLRNGYAVSVAPITITLSVSLANRSTTPKAERMKGVYNESNCKAAKGNPRFSADNLRRFCRGTLNKTVRIKNRR